MRAKNRKAPGRLDRYGAARERDSWLEEGRFKAIEVSHSFAVSRLKHIVLVIMEKPQPTMFR